MNLRQLSKKVKMFHLNFCRNNMLDSMQLSAALG